MQTVDLKITLSDQVAREAREAGLLTQRGIERLIEQAVRRESGRKLLDAMARLRDADGPPLTEDDIAAEVAAVRARRRSA
jgi:cytochrome P450